MKTAILFVTHIYNEDIKRQIVKLDEETKDFATLYVGFQADKVGITLPDGIRPFPFTVKELNRLGYRSWGCTLMDGNFHFVMLDFYLKHAGYDYYWLIEYDVRFNGDWKNYFGFFADKDDDFISAHIRDFSGDTRWTRWKEIELVNIKLNHKILLHSFNPICRFSDRALSLLNERCLLGDRGHNEVLMPTLFRYFNLKISDFGGNGRFIYTGCSGLFYTDDPNDVCGDKCTHRFRPAHTEGEMALSGMIYHPVK